MEPLPDPFGDRVVNEIPPPPVLPLAEELLFPNSDSKVPDWQVVRDHLAREGKITKEHFVKMINDVTDIFRNEPNLIQFPEPLVMVGDIHGQLYDLIHLIEKAGDPSCTNYIFMGDYVDRGIYGVEVIILMISIKLNYPETFSMLRGNHECRNMTDHFTFREETIDKYDEEVYDLIMEMFDALPICALADKKYFITHGGISPELKKISKINKIDRFMEVPMDGIMCDLMWADPIDEKEAKSYDFIENQERDCSFYFGKKPAKKLIEDNNLMTIVRAHQVQIEGYKMHRWDGPSSFPYVITIFSAPNYCDYYSNKGSVLILEDGNVSIKQFDDSEHPYHLPDKIDIFTWSMPFLIDKVIQMMKSVYTKWQDDEPVDEEGFKSATSAKDRAEKIKGKVKAFARVTKMYKTLTEESELIIKLKGMVPDGKIPRGLLLEGRPAIKDAITEFERAKELDKKNEMRPKKKKKN